MLLSQTSLYALRAMVQLACEYEDGPVPSGVLAEKTNVPPHYLSKIMRKLVQDGCVSAQKGHHGGFRLMCPPDQITFLDILRVVDSEPTETICAFGWEQCNDNNPCPLHDYWRKLNEDFRTWAKETSLADVIENINTATFPVRIR